MPQPSQREQGAPPETWKFFDLQDFGGLNTRSPRQTIGDNEFSWIENLFPIAPGNLRAMYGKGTTLYSATGGNTIVYFFFYVLSGTSYVFVCLSDGTAVQVNTATGATTTISSTAGTFYNGGTLPACEQWGSKYLQIVNTVTSSGYFIWDGAVLYKAGSLAPVVTITNAGSGYTSAPTVNFYGGSGSAAAGTSTVTNGSVTSISLTNAGSGYFVTDNLVQIQITGGGSTSKHAKLTATLTGRAITGVTIVDGGAGYLTAPTITVTGGGGSGATITATLTAGVITATAIGAGGSNYTSVPALVVTGGGNTAATATVVLMPFGLSGNAISNYQSRTWIAKSSQVSFSAAGDLGNFGTPFGGGTFSSNDGFLKTSFINLKQQSSYLYLFGDSSINNISNVVSSGSPVTTTFTNVNNDAQVGTPWRDSVNAYGLALTLGNSSGFYLVLGGAAQKISEPLDGLFSTATLPSTGSGIPSAVATVFGIKILMFLMTVVDPFTGSLTPKLVCYESERKKWFIASQEVALTYISTQEVNSVLTSWGTDGTDLFPLFNKASNTLVKKAYTKLWNGDSYIWQKQFLRLYNQVFDLSSTGANITYIVNTDIRSSASVTLSGAGDLTFKNNSNQTLQFKNNTPANLNFKTSGNSINMQNIDSCYGNLMGLQLSSTSPDFVIAAMGIGYTNYNFKQ